MGKAVKIAAPIGIADVAGLGGAWVQEAPKGVRDGSNTVFTLSWTPQVSVWSDLPVVILSLNGVELTPFDYASQGFYELGGDYSLSGNIITMAKPPKYTDYLVATYFPEGAPPAGGGPGSGIPSAASLTITSSFTPGSPAAYVAMSLWDIELYGNTAASPVGVSGDYLDCSPLVNQNSGYLETTQTWALISSPPPAYQVSNTLHAGPYPLPAYTADTLADLLSSLVLTVYVWDSSGGDAAAALNLYDCYLEVTVDGVTTTYRPQAYRVIPASPSADGSVTNPANAIDSDATTYATVTMNTSGTYQPGFLQLYNFG